MCMRLRSLRPPPVERAVSRGGGAARVTPIGMTPAHSPEAETRDGTRFYSAMTKPTRAKRPDAPGEGAHRLVLFFRHRHRAQVPGLRARMNKAPRGSRAERRASPCCRKTPVREANRARARARGDPANSEFVRPARSDESE